MNEQIFHKVDARDIQSVTNALIKLILGDYSDIINAEKIASLLISHNNEEFELLVENLPCDNKVKRELLDSRKLVEELNPDNNSTFENEIDEIINDVDICEGVKDLLELENGSSIEDKEEAIRKSGIKYVKRRIQHYLIDSKISSRVSVEYSLLSSTLDPENPDKLQCCSFVIGDEDFVSAIDDYYTSCIDYTADEKTGKGLSIYQHPHFLYNIPILNTPSSYMPCIDDDTITDVYLNGKGLTITNKKCRILNKNTQGSKYEIKNKNGGNYIRCGGYAIEAFSLRRPFKEMLLGAKQKSDEETRGYKLVSCDPLEDVQNTLHSFCHKNITCSPSRARIGEEKYSVYVSFPIYGSRASNQLPQYEIENIDGPTALQGIGACFIYFEPNNDIVNTQSYVQLIRLVIDKISYEVSKFIRFVSANYMFNLGLQLQENARKEAIKSAKAAIMSRNMSHNLGSHVMSYLKQHLGSVKDMLNDRIFSLLFESEDDMLQKLSEEVKKKIENSDKIALPFLVGLGQFISYLQERQDFIATIATDFIPYYSNVNFKDFIYDELNPDKRYERHKDRANLKVDNILLGNIARSEGLGRPTSPTQNTIGESDLSDIIIKFRKFDGNPVEGTDANGVAIDETNQDIIEKKKSLNDMRDYDVSLPGGVVGRQAIFSIIENVIRNAAKHGNWRKNNKLELTIDIYTKEELLAFAEINQLTTEIEQKDANNNVNIEDLRLKKEDKLKSIENTHQGIVSLLNDKSNGLSLWEVFDKFYKNASDSNDLYYVTLTDNLQFDESSLAKLRGAICEGYVNERGVMEEANKGIKEMRISSSWLRSLSAAEESSNRPELNFETSTPNSEMDQKSKILEALKYDTDWEVKPGHIAPILYARISNGHLQYIFCLMRPKKIAFISSRFKDRETFNNNKLTELCWGAYTPNDFLNLHNKSYEFILFDDELDGAFFNLIRGVSSSRLLKFSDILGKKGFPQQSELLELIKTGNVSKEKALDIISNLYEILSANIETDNIAIHDYTAWNKIPYDGENKDSIVKKGIVTICKSGGVFSPYIYRTHYETEENFNIVINDIVDGKNYQNTLFIEGITGNNSTDRLVRNEDFNEIWAFKHLHAMKQKIAIFDERIFSKIYGKEENDFSLSEEKKLSISKQKTLDYLEKIINKLNNKDLSPEEQKTLSEAIDVKEIIPEEIENIEELKDLLSELEFLKVPLDDIFDYTILANSFNGTANYQKGISIFSLIRDEDNQKSFKLCGLRWDCPNNVASTLKRNIIGEDDKGNSIYKSYSKCEVLAKITWDISNEEEPLSIKEVGVTPKILYSKGFDKISIHQGLLDKLYEGFGIKDNPKEKERLTKALFDLFSNKSHLAFHVNEAIRNNDNQILGTKELQDKWFLPGFSIHSGRSKPGESDMPQHLPFIQYAAIEHAVLDCKFSLVELLDYARYE